MVNIRVSVCRYCAVICVCVCIYTVIPVYVVRHIIPVGAVLNGVPIAVARTGSVYACICDRISIEVSVDISASISIDIAVSVHILRLNIIAV